MTKTVTQQSTLQFQKSYQDPLDTLTLRSPDRVGKSCQFLKLRFVYLSVVTSVARAHRVAVFVVEEGQLTEPRIALSQ